MRVCLIATELFLWGKAGGYGRATRMIGRELARRGVEVCAVVPTPRGQPAQASLDVDGIRVLSFTPEKVASSKALYAQCDADIYHSQEATLGSYFAMRAMPDRKHLITFRDPRSWHDWWVEFLYPTRSKIQLASTCAYFENPFVRWAVRHADARFCAAHFLIDKVRRKFPNIPRPDFLPTPIVLPDVVEKAEEPTVCTVGRLDRRKRPEFVLAVARQFPQVRFIVVGTAQDQTYDALLRERAASLPNVDMTGHIDQFRTDRLAQILAGSWILLNTSPREGLPNAFLEACAHGCAILSSVDPDGFASRFGVQVHGDDYSAGLNALLTEDNWRARGQAGRAYVAETFVVDRAIEKHLAAYASALN